MALMEDFYKSVLEQDEAAVVLCDLNHIIVYMNPAAACRYAKSGYYERHMYRNRESGKLYDLS